MQIFRVVTATKSVPVPMIVRKLIARETQAAPLHVMVTNPISGSVAPANGPSVIRAKKKTGGIGALALIFARHEHARIMATHTILKSNPAEEESVFARAAGCHAPTGLMSGNARNRIVKKKHCDGNLEGGQCGYDKNGLPKYWCRNLSCQGRPPGYTCSTGCGGGCPIRPDVTSPSIQDFFLTYNPGPWWQVKDSDISCLTQFVTRI